MQPSRVRAGRGTGAGKAVLQEVKGSLALWEAGEQT